MKTSLFLIATALVCVMFASPATAGNKYVGTKACAPCHKAEKIGNQFGIWQKAKHSEAFKVLTTPAADKIAKDRGSKKPAAETEDCLGCHTTTADVAAKEAGFDVKDGVQCETCHGAGSAYKNMAIMKDHAKAVAAGLTDFKVKDATEAYCKKCHNEKSPSYKPFKFDEYWSKIKHDVPKKS